MTELIVLGTIPGTTIQIDFTFWIYMSITVVFVGLVAEYWRHRRSLHRWLAGYILAFVLAHSAMRQRQWA